MLGGPIADVLRRPGFTGLQRLVNGSTSFEEASARIDWDRTLAYSYPIPEGIYLNRYNPDLTGARAQEVVRDLKRRLEAYPDARIEALEPSALYRGRNLGRAPALLLRIDDMATEPWMDFRYDRPLVKERPAFFYGSGTHRMDGILIGSGDGVSVGRSSATLSLLDLAPTILEGMGLLVPPELTGRSLVGDLGLRD